MQLEILKDLKSIAGSRVTENYPNFGLDRPVFVDFPEQRLTFQFHSGWSVEVLIETARLILEGMNQKQHITGNEMAINALDKALMCLGSPYADRSMRAK